ncbi:hypothetical protein Bca101_018164 [Brassica carinata]
MIWVRNKVRGDNGFGVVTKSLKSKPVLFCSLALCPLNIVLMLLSGFYWYESGWSDNDQLLATVSWGTLSICLHRCSDHEQKKSPFLLMPAIRTTILLGPSWSGPGTITDRLDHPLLPSHSAGFN